MTITRRTLFAVPAVLAVPAIARAEDCANRTTGALGLIVERATGSILIVDTMAHAIISRIEGLGDLSHATATFSPDQRHAFVFGRDGGLTKVDMVEARIAARTMQAGNAIGGAISDDGRLIAVSNYEPGGINIFSSETLERLHEIPAKYGEGGLSKTVGLVDLPGQRFMVSLYESGEIWLIDCSGDKPRVDNLGRAGDQPYDGYVTADGRFYLAGLFGEDGLALVDTWQEPMRIVRVLDGYGRGEEPLPVYKMPHLEGWAASGRALVLPAVGRHEALIVDSDSFRETGRLALHGQPVFCVAQPGGRYVWVNFAPPHNDTLQIIDMRDMKIIDELKPGPGVLHIEFSPRGHEVWLSVRDENRIDILNTATRNKIAELPAEKPSGIFFTARANRIGL